MQRGDLGPPQPLGAAVGQQALLVGKQSAHLMKQVAAYYAELAQLNETTLREEHRRQLESMEAQAAEGAQREQELQRIQGELACIRQIAAEVDRRLAGLQSTIDDIVAEHRDTLYNGLMKSFEAFVQAEGERLLDDVWAHAERPEFAWHHTWRLGDLVLWDNRCVMHRRNSFDPAARRVMHRTQVKGDRPYLRSAA